MTTIDEELIRDVTRVLVERFQPKRIVLFGSYARGDARPDSDLDLMVEMDTEKRFFVRNLELLRSLRPRTWPMDLLVFTPDEVRRQRDIVGTLVNIIEREGRVLYAASEQS